MVARVGIVASEEAYKTKNAICRVQCPSLPLYFVGPGAPRMGLGPLPMCRRVWGHHQGGMAQR